jgi:hypothetical protein
MHTDPDLFEKESALGQIVPMATTSGHSLRKNFQKATIVPPATGAL